MRVALVEEAERRVVVVVEAVGWRLGYWRLMLRSRSPGIRSMSPLVSPEQAARAERARVTTAATVQRAKSSTCLPVRAADLVRDCTPYLTNSLPCRLDGRRGSLWRVAAPDRVAVSSGASTCRIARASIVKRCEP